MIEIIRKHMKNNEKHIKNDDLYAFLWFFQKLIKNRSEPIIRRSFSRRIRICSPNRPKTDPGPNFKYFFFLNFIFFFAFFWGGA